MKTNFNFKLTNTERIKTFHFSDKADKIIIRKLILTPKFSWKKPDEWSQRLSQQELFLQVNTFSSKGGEYKQPYYLSTFNDPYYFQPTFILKSPIILPLEKRSDFSFDNDFPLKTTVEFCGSTPVFEFDMLADCESEKYEMV